MSVIWNLLQKYFVSKTIFFIYFDIKMEKIKILTTWGTIFADENDHKRNSAKNTKSKKEELKLSLQNFVNVDDLEELYNIDSSDLRSERIELLAKKLIELENSGNSYAWYLISHWTDTMAYTASILSYLLQWSKKPIMLTWSMIPLESEGTDAKNNIINSAKAILSKKLNWVYINFWDNIINWSRVKKMHTNNFDTFQSPNWEPDWKFIEQENWSKILKVSKNDVILNKSNELFDTFNSKVDVLRLTPTTDLSIFKYYRELWLDWLILEWYWDGNVPWEDEKSKFAKEFQSEIQECLKSWMTIVLKSQCPYGESIHQYKWASMLLDEWVLSAKSMTTESAQAKLMRLLGNYKDKQKIKELYWKNIVWEFS